MTLYWDGAMSGGAPGSGKMGSDPPPAPLRPPPGTPSSLPSLPRPPPSSPALQNHQQAGEAIVAGRSMGAALAHVQGKMGHWDAARAGATRRGYRACM